MSDINPDMTTPEGRNLTSKTLIGDTVKNSRGETLGNVQDFMIDLARGSVAYVVVSSGGVLGIGDKLFAVPWSAFTLDSEGHNLILDVAKERFKDAEGFDKGNWPNTADPAWQRGTDEYYGVSSDVFPQ